MGIITFYHVFSGEVDDEGDAASTDDSNWNEYWRILFNKVTLDDIKNFEKKYKNSGKFFEFFDSLT